MKKKSILFLATWLSCSSLGIKAQVATFQWAESTGSATSDDYTTSVCTDGDNNIITIGAMTGDMDADPGPGVQMFGGASGIYLQKFNPSGNLIWARQINGVFAGSTDDMGRAYPANVITDADNNIYIGGSFTRTVYFAVGSGISMTSATDPTCPTTTTKDGFIMKIDPDGNTMWAFNISGPSDDQVTQLALDHSGNVYAIGSFVTSAEFYPGSGSILTAGPLVGASFLAKYSTDGYPIWANMLSQINYGFTSLTVDEDNHPIITGSLHGTIDVDMGPDVYNLTGSIYTYQGYIEKLDSDGNFIWAKQLGYSGSLGCGSLITDPSNNIYLTGGYTGTVDLDPDPVSTAMVSSDKFLNGFLIKLTPDGHLMWKSTYTSGGCGGLALDSENNIYLPLSPGDTMNVSLPYGTSTTIVSENEYDAAIIKITENGDLVWTRHFEDESIAVPMQTTIDHHNAVILGGYYEVGMDANPGAGTCFLDGFGNSLEKAFVLKLSQQNSNQTGINGLNKPGSVLNVYPNPNNGIFTLELSSNSQVTLYDVAGQLVYTADLKAGTNQITLFGAQPGVYLLQVKGPNENSTMKMVKQ